MHTVGVGPIRLDGNGREPFFADQPLCDLSSLTIKLPRPMGGFTKKHELGIANAVEELIVVMAGPFEPMNAIAECARKRRRHVTPALLRVVDAGFSSPAG